MFYQRNRIMDKSNATQGFPTAQFARNLLRGLKLGLAALATGSRWVPLADNRKLVRDLAARAARSYGQA